jgi:hypothetical protein
MTPFTFPDVAFVGNVAMNAVPANALRDRAGNPILDRAGNYILTREE